MVVEVAASCSTGSNLIRLFWSLPSIEFKSNQINSCLFEHSPRAQILLVSDTLLHESLTVLSPHQTRIQRSTIPLEGAGPLSLGRVPTATWPGRGGPRRRRHPCCPVRSLRRRNTSTYPCCWRKRASAPLTTPSTKVTDQILQLLAPRCWVRHKCVLEPCHSLCPCLRFAAAAVFRLFFSATITTSLAAGFCAKLPFFLKKKEEFTNFYGVFLLPGLQTIFCSICTLKNCVNCEIFS